MKKKTTFLLLFLIPAVSMAQWNQVRYDQVNNYMKAHAISSSSVVVAGMDQMFSYTFFMRTNDAGLTWDSIPVGSTATSYQIGSLVFTDLYNGYAGGLNNGRQALLKTIDNATTWSDVTPDTSSLEIIKSISFINPQEGFVASRTDIYKTVSGGAAWTTLNIPVMNLEDISFVDMNTGYAGGESGMQAVVHKTTDGGITWSNVMTASVPGLFSTGSRKIEALSASTIYTSLLYSNILLRTMDGGLTWDTVTVPQIFEVQDYDFTSMLNGHVLSSMGEIYGTTDGGISWNYEYSVAGGAYGPSVFLNSISFVDDIGYVCGSSGLIKKHDPSVTALDERQEESVWLLYPNPMDRNGVLQFNNNVQHISLYNNKGQLLLQEELNGSALHLSGRLLQPGLYTILAADKGRLHSCRFIVE